MHFTFSTYTIDVCENSEQRKPCPKPWGIFNLLCGLGYRILSFACLSQRQVNVWGTFFINPTNSVDIPQSLVLRPVI